MVIVVVMVFCLVFLVLGLALYWLSTGQVKATETERRDIGSFNVAEAGVDAGMLALKLNWPDSVPATEGTPVVVVDEYLVKAALQDENGSLYDPTKSSPSEFIQVSVYDNSIWDEGTGSYVEVTEPPSLDKRIYWDALADNTMYVDATSNVDDNHHRILLKAERQPWNLEFPVEIALRSTVVDSNAQGFGIEIEVPPPGTSQVLYDVETIAGKGLEIDDPANVIPNPDDPIEFGQVITENLLAALESIARQKGTYFESDALAEDYVEKYATELGGKVIYVRSNNPVEIATSEDIASVDKPVVVVIDTPENTENSWDMSGGTMMYGILVVLGNGELSGTPSVHGAMYVEGTLLNSGNGEAQELAYNYDVIRNIRRQYTTSVNIVANTWEEYTGGEGE